MISQDERTLTIEEVLKLLQQATILHVFRGGEICAFTDDHTRNERHVRRLPDHRRYLSEEWITEYDAENLRWLNHLGTKTYYIPSRKGAKTITEWIKSLPDMEHVKYNKLNVYIRDHRGWRLDPLNF